MIQPKELRTGNYVECFGIRQICGIKEHKIKVRHETEKGNYILEWCPVNSNELKPIPLTEEWLITFRYIKLSEKYFTIQGHLIWICNDLFMCDKNGIVLKYVHQLQNLYYALNQKELTHQKIN